MGLCHRELVVRVVVGCVLAFVGAQAASAAPNDNSEVGDGKLAVLAGGGGGLSGIGDLPGPLLELHAGAGRRARRWMAAGLVSYAYTDGKPLLAYWSITRHDLALVGVVTVQPLSRRELGLHAQVGIGAAFDRLSGTDADIAVRAVSSSIGAGISWAPLALTYRYVIPEAKVCSDRCYRIGAQGQLLLSLTIYLQ
jgi:hypothetical protein